MTMRASLLLCLLPSVIYGGYAGEITLRGDTDFTLSAAWPIAKPKTCLNNCCTGIVINMHGLAL